MNLKVDSCLETQDSLLVRFGLHRHKHGFVCVCVCVCMYVCMYGCMYVCCMSASSSVLVCTSMYWCVHVCMLCMLAFVYTSICLCHTVTVTVTVMDDLFRYSKYKKAPPPSLVSRL
jgi:hypothetical protein